MSEEVDDQRYVRDITDMNAMEWRAQVITEKFNERDVRCILAIPISCQGQCDELIWSFVKDNNYTVKSAYMLGKRCTMDNFHQAWVEIWGVKISPKVRHVL